MKIFIAAIVLIGVSELIAWHGPRLAWPVSDSLPRGLYAYVPGDARRGDVARVCLPPALADYARAKKIDRADGDCPNGLVPLGKIVAGVAGDVVDVGPQGVRIDGALWPQSQQKNLDSRGRRVDLKEPFGLHRLGTGQVWLMGLHRDSWDSRYFGPIASSSLDGRYIPLLVQKGTDQ